VASKTNSTKLLLFYIAPRQEQQVIDEMKQLVRENPGATIYVSGSNEFLALVQFNSNIHFLPTVEALLKEIE
jgi:hypothetical protein